MIEFFEQFKVELYVALTCFILSLLCSKLLNYFDSYNDIYLDIFYRNIHNEWWYVLISAMFLVYSLIGSIILVLLILWIWGRVL